MNQTVLSNNAHSDRMKFLDDNSGILEKNSFSSSGIIKTIIELFPAYKQRFERVENDLKIDIENWWFRESTSRPKPTEKQIMSFFDEVNIVSNQALFCLQGSDVQEHCASYQLLSNVYLGMFSYANRSIENFNVDLNKWGKL